MQAKTNSDRASVGKSLDFNDSSSIIVESCLNDNLDVLSLNFQSGLISQLELENIIQEYFFSILSFVRDVDKIIADMFVLKDTDIR